MLHLMKSKQKIENTDIIPEEIYSPIDGKLIDLEDVDDPVFSGGMMGDGLAIIPSNNDIYSPFNAEVILVPSSLHAIGLRNDQGKELLLHIGLDTVSLNGKYFKILVQIGQKITKGELIAKVHFKKIEKLGLDTTTVIIMTDGTKVSKTKCNRIIKHGELIMKMEKENESFTNYK